MATEIMREHIADIATQHPCFAQGAKPTTKGRIHLPVSPGCNIACRFCERSLNTHEQRPGVTTQTLKPHETLELIERALKAAPELTVVGIAGPGDTLATPYALETFRLVKERFPQLIRCMSTNGLLLSRKLDKLIDAGVNTLTVTVNDIDPERLVHIVDYIVYQGELLTGLEATRILIANQLEGIKKAAEKGVVVKVNTVLVPTVNDAHIASIAHTVKQAGASLYNIIPLIPHAQLAHLPAPTCAQIDAARSAAEAHITVFRHCQHCRADAIGIPGGVDHAPHLYQTRLNTPTPFSHG